MIAAKFNNNSITTNFKNNTATVPGDFVAKSDVATDVVSDACQHHGYSKREK